MYYRETSQELVEKVIAELTSAGHTVKRVILGEELFMLTVIYD